MSIFRPLPRWLTQTISAIVMLAWVGVMIVLVNRSYLHASSNLATDLARYGSAATWRGVYYRGDKIGFTVSQTVPRGDGFDLEPRDSLKLQLIVRVLTRWPEYRLRVLGAAPRRREPGAIPGMAEAEWVKRALVQAGIDSERIEIGQVPEAERVCPEREPLCGAGRRHVRTMVARP